MPNGNIRAFQCNTKDKRGVSEWNITNIMGVSPTIISSAPPKILVYEESEDADNAARLV